MSSHLQEKLYHFESAPPASVWEGIATALDREAHSYPNRLYHYEQAPGAAVWETISTQLAAAADIPATPVVPLRRSFRLAKYAAAAAVLLFLATGISYLVRGKEEPKVAQASAPSGTPGTSTAKTPQALTPTNNEQLTPSEPTNEEPAKDNPQLSSATAQVQLPANKPVQYAAAIYIPNNDEVMANEPVVVPQERSLINAALADRYMIATKADGDVVRLPKKAYSDFACATYPRLAMNQPCKEKIATLQNRMAAAMTTDFAQFIDLLQNLQENR